ncbi:MAG: hypothetical protein ABSB66_00330 [Candidatus Acidiferrales bacterium]
MFRHHYITDQREIAALSNFIENLEEEMRRPFRPQQMHTTITTAGNKVQMAQSITASQALFHPENPNPSNPEGFGTPHGPRELSSELVVWYYPLCRHVNGENIETKGFATRQIIAYGQVQQNSQLAFSNAQTDSTVSTKIEPQH